MIRHSQLEIKLVEAKTTTFSLLGEGDFFFSVNNGVVDRDNLFMKVLDRTKSFRGEAAAVNLETAEVDTFKGTAVLLISKVTINISE